MEQDDDDNISENFSLDSADEGDSDEEEENKHDMHDGFDQLRARDMDIPQVNDIPIVSKLSEKS